ncbi:GntR family transcriptional regulator [Oceanobacillus halophilus]|uniref:GntR family transcriptional regulator n=1 Tax=Oceanobacillus halophilus TaxID=930130 RepID=A0A494ZZU2_9BACI|nr:GntR family transcriptional regulator [Oceanobacillus halophilus]RKQ32519.1 GntR family transcriptional regulator [Oceanobacillus halophilus]
MIDKNSPIPIYYQLEEEIKRMIQEELNPGDLLPSEREYAEKYDISRMTVRQAITNLVKEGMIYRQKGRGSFVADKKFEQDLSGLSSFSEDMERRGMTPSNKLLSFNIIKNEPHIASILKIERNEPIYEIQRIRMANNEPVALETIYTPKSHVGDITKEDISISFYDYIEKHLNLNIAYGEQTIEASLANKEETHYLHIRLGDPVLVMHRTSYLKNDQETPIEYVKSIYRSDKYKFKMQMKRD